MTDTLPPLKSLALAAMLCAALIPAPCLGGETDVPELYARFVPAYPVASGQRYVDMRCQALVTFTTTDSPETVISFYRQAMTQTGWNMINQVERSGQWTIAFEYDSYRLVVSAAQAPSAETETTLFIGGPE